MTKVWHPPIPAGLATSQAVRNLTYEMAIILLLYLYDNVEKDGRVQIDLREVACEIGRPYGTVRRWWRCLREGPFFTRIQDKGREGFIVWFDRQWIDWHVMRSNAQGSNMIAEDTGTEDETGSQGSDLILEKNTERSFLIADTENESLNALIAVGERSSVIVEDSGNKVLMIDHESMLPSSQNTHMAPSVKVKKPRAPKATQESLPDSVRELIFDLCCIDRDLCTHPQRMQVYQTTKLIRTSATNQGQPDEIILAHIQYIAWYYREVDWRGKKGQSLTPVLIRELWRPALEYRTQQQPRASPSVVASRASPELTPEEMTARIEANKQMTTEWLQRQYNGKHATSQHDPTGHPTEHGG